MGSFRLTTWLFVLTWIVTFAAARVELVGLLHLGVHLVARSRCFALMSGGSLLQPRGFGSLYFSLRLCGPCLGGSLLAKRFTAFHLCGVFENLVRGCEELLLAGADGGSCRPTRQSQR